MRKSIRSTTLAAGGAVLLVTIAACGGSGTASSSTTASAAPAAPSSAAGSRADGFAAYRDCMTQNGVALPDLRGGQGGPPSGFPTARPSGAPGDQGAGRQAFPLPSGVEQGAFDKAQQACASLRPQFGGPVRIDQSALVAFTSCMADHGVTVPTGQSGLRDLDRTDPTVKAAFDTCAPLLP
jgi:hypothetical protein